MSATFKPGREKSRIIGLEEVLRRVPWSESKIRRDMKAGKFPQQAKKLEGSTSAGWYEDDIDDLLESLRPESSTKDRSELEREVSQAEVEEAHHLRPPLPLNLRKGIAPQRRTVKEAENDSLIRTGIKLQGQDVFCHVPSRRLLVVVGSMSEEYLAAVTKLSA